ncbi:MAG: hypothetical protein JWM27_3610 [Gemmatimonadetes bacterium]|nr:hypothetical protein [Gemmatimonadota bacterium]
MRQLRFVSLPAALCGTFALCAPAAAQQVVVQQQPVALTVTQNGVTSVTLPEATEFVVRLTDAVSSRTSAEGDGVGMRVDADVVVNGYTIVRAGTPVVAKVAEAHRSGRMGRGGALSLNVESVVAVNGQRIRLRAAKSREGDGAVGSTVALTVLFGPLGLLKRGHEASYPANTPITVYTNDPVTVAFAAAAAAPAVMVQQQPVPVPAPTQP